MLRTSCYFSPFTYWTTVAFSRIFFFERTYTLKSTFYASFAINMFTTSFLNKVTIITLSTFRAIRRFDNTIQEILSFFVNHYYFLGPLKLINLRGPRKE